MQTTRRFVALESFDSPDFRSSYCDGLTYTIRPGNDRLAEAAERWLAEGKIAFLVDRGVAAPPASAAAVVTVKEP